MLKKLSLRKIGLASAALFAILLIYLMPGNSQKLDINTDLQYTEPSANVSPIFLMDKNQYVALTKVALSSNQIEDKAKELLNVLTVGGADSKIPSGFTAVIPPDTQILSLKYEKELVKVDFSKDLLDVNEKQEEKMVEAIIYSLTSIEDIKKVIIYVEGEILTYLPKSKVILPSTLDRSFGINKQYDFTKTDNINEVTVYYVNEIHNTYYYVPVTKYLNDERDKITIVIDQLTNSFNHNEKLMSFLNDGTKLVSSKVDENKINLEFNSLIFDDITTKEVLEEVIYTICLSAMDNYPVNEVIFTVENKEIYKTTLKSLEYKNKI